MALEGVFRFVSLRAAVVSELPQLGNGIRVFDEETPFYRDVHERAGEGSASAVRDLAERFMKTGEYVSRVEDADEAAPVLEWFTENGDEPAAGTELPPAQPEHHQLRQRIADSLLADSIARPAAAAARTDRKTLLAKLLTLITTDEAPRGANADVSLR